MSMKKLFPIIMFCMSMMLPLVSCTNLDETNQRLDDLEYQVTDLQSTLKVLSDAFNEGKQIKNITNTMRKLIIRLPKTVVQKNCPL